MGVTPDPGLPAHIPAGWPTVIPRLAVSDPQACVRFLQSVFDAQGRYNQDRPSEMRVGDSLIMVGGLVDRNATNTFLYVYVPATDSVFQKALEGGATCIEAPAEMPYGDRRAMIADPWGNRWQIATHRRFTAK